MSKKQTSRMLARMASGEPVELASPMASVKKLARLAFVAQQFGYEYADVRQGGGANNSALRMLIVPDPSPRARARAAQNWAQYPNAGDGVSVPPPVPDALELLKARINFDLTGRNGDRRIGYGALGVTVGCVVLAFRAGGRSGHFVMAAAIWLFVMVLLAIGFVVNRRRNAKFAALLGAAGFVPVPDATGRTRYLPPGSLPPGHGLPGHGPGSPYGHPAPGPYGQQPPLQPYPPQQPAPGPYAPQQPAPADQYAPQQPAPGPYAPPQAPYGQQPQAPYGQGAQPPYPQQGPHGTWPPAQQPPHWGPQPPSH
ncbi:hypothetical protein AB0M23_20895 [Streptomyces sp. NPDC052077]|uniref:hypothetical protein n=1 Tax=Streptomyces sp. NPDC052077 TaxID=3154757 RepID=UPI003444DA8B